MCSKKKNANDMHINDWSSDVCYANLEAEHPAHHGFVEIDALDQAADHLRAAEPGNDRVNRHRHHRGDERDDHQPDRGRQPQQVMVHRGEGRSEEHTSELLSLMRITFAVCCLKKNINQLTYKI